MRTAPILLLAGLILGIVPSDVAAQNSAPVVHEVVITVNPQGQVVLSLDPVQAIPQDRVIFSAPGSERFTIDFPEGTPFENRTITGSGQQPRNVPIPPGKIREQPYKYDITLVVGGTTYTLDPEIVVRDRRGR
jgi:hypothetical protein